MEMFLSKAASLDLLIQLPLEELCLGQDPFLIKAGTDKSCKGTWRENTLVMNQLCPSPRHI